MECKAKFDSKEIKNQLVLAAGTYNGELYFPPETIKKTVSLTKRIPVYLNSTQDNKHLVGAATNFRLKNNKMYCDVKIEPEYFESFALDLKNGESNGATIKRIEIAGLSIIPNKKVIKKERAK